VARIVTEPGGRAYRRGSPSGRECGCIHSARIASIGSSAAAWRAG
jgi:hypothetical protein